MPLSSGAGVIGAAAVCAALIAIWVGRNYGRDAALVMGAIAAAGLACVWVSYEVLPVEAWRYGDLLRTLAVFAPPTVVAIWVCIAHKSTASTRHKTGLIAAFTLGPVLVVYVSQIHVGTLRSLPAESWWALSCIAFYVLIPAVYSRLSGERIRSYGLSLAFIKTEASLLLVTIPVIAALAWMVAADARFQLTYPFFLYSPDQGIGTIQELLIFELMYGMTFVALEFFYRGFMVHAGQPVFGIHAVPVMAFYYLLIHLGKPMPECAASLIGGLLLGYVSLRLRSIAVGVAAHLTLAWGVDAAVISQR